jgi:hypothetical protein
LAPMITAQNNLIKKKGEACWMGPTNAGNKEGLHMGGGRYPMSVKPKPRGWRRWPWPPSHSAVTHLKWALHRQLNWVLINYNKIPSLREILLLLLHLQSWGFFFIQFFNFFKLKIGEFFPTH